MLGFNFKTDTVFLCEVTTHIGGLRYKNNAETVERIRRKHKRQRSYAKRYLDNFAAVRYQFWSPNVPVGYRTEHLAQIEGLELVINGFYKERVEALRGLS